jgi:hypothetical protein
VIKLRTVLGGTLALGLALEVPATSFAQPQQPTSGTVMSADLRVEWEQVSIRGEWRNICGRVYNDNNVTATHVFIRFENVDDTGKVVANRDTEVIGDVPTRGSAIYCTLVQAKGVSYRVSVPRVDWGQTRSMSGAGQ